MSSKKVCKTSSINSLTKYRIYDIIKGSFEVGSFLIKDDFENEQWYYYEYFYTIEELRDVKLQTLLGD